MIEFDFGNPQTGKPVSDGIPTKLLSKMRWADAQSAHGFIRLARGHTADAVSLSVEDLQDARASTGPPHVLEKLLVA